MRTALVVDDEEVIRAFLQRYLRISGFEVEAVGDGAAGIARARARAFDLIFIDVRMPKMDGLQALMAMRSLQPEARYVMMSGYAVADILEEARRQGAVACVKKPFEIDELRELISSLFQDPGN